MNGLIVCIVSVVGLALTIIGFAIFSETYHGNNGRLLPVISLIMFLTGLFILLFESVILLISLMQYTGVLP